MPKQTKTKWQYYYSHQEQLAKQFLTALEALLALERELEKVYVYASMKNDQDTSETKYQAMMAKVQKLVAEASAKNAWFQPELLALTPAKLAAYYEAEIGRAHV